MSTATSRPRTRPGSSPRRSPAGWTPRRRPTLRQQLRLQPGQGDLDPEGGGLQEGLERDLRRRRPASRCPSPSSTTAGSPTGWPRCRPSRPSLKAVGIQVTPENLAATTYQSDLYTGKYQLGYDAETGGPTPYFELRQWLYSANSAPIGTAAGLQLRAVQQPGHRRADQRVRRHHERGHAALDRGPAAEGHAAATCRSSRSPRRSTGSSTTPAASPAGSPRATRTRSRPRTTTRTGASMMLHLAPK